VFWRDPQDTARLIVIENLVGLLRALPFQINLWEVQNDYYHVLTEHYPDMRTVANKGDPDARAWVERFLPLGTALGIRVE
jgi:hypothetical protein